MISGGFFKLGDIIDLIKRDAGLQGILVHKWEIHEWLASSIDEILHFHVPNIRVYVFSYADKQAILKIAREKKFKF